MEAKVSLKYIRITPRKMNRVAKLIRKKRIENAISTLQFSTLSASLPMRKLLNSAVANYKLKSGKDNMEDVFVHELVVSNGPTLKRMRPRARGVGARILKRSSHVYLTIKDKENK